MDEENGVGGKKDMHLVPFHIHIHIELHEWKGPRIVETVEMLGNVCAERILELSKLVPE